MPAIVSRTRLLAAFAAAALVGLGASVEPGFTEEPAPAAAPATDAAPAAADAPAAAAATQTAALPEGVTAEQMESGAALFKRNCRQCHGSKGTAGVPLANNGKIASEDYLAQVIITGPGYMSAFGDALNDQQIADISTYVRNSWGNDFGPVGPEVVARSR